VQAFVLRSLLFQGPCKDWQNPTAVEKQAALTTALSEMVWRAAGPDGKCVICVPSDGASLPRSSTYFPDGFTESLVLHDLVAPDPEALVAFFDSRMHHFSDPKGSGALLLLVSVMLTRGLETISSDMDEGFAGEVSSP
jgi:hypothetical protein